MAELIRLRQRAVTAVRRRGGKPLVHGGGAEPPDPTAPNITRVWLDPDGDQPIGTIIRCNVQVSGYPPPGRSFDWLVDGVSAGAPDSPLFDTTNLSAGEVVTCEVTADNGVPPAAVQVSENSVTMQDVVVLPPQITVSPTISPDGFVNIGTIISTTNGLWIGDPPITYSYEWLADGVPIPDENEQTFDTTGLDVNTVIQSRVTASNVGGPSIPEVSSNFATLQPADRASQLLVNETDGLAIAFAENLDANYKQTGSMLIKTANAGDVTGVLDGGVVYAGTSPKIVRQADNTLKHALHNTIVGSETLNGSRWSADITTVTPGADAGPDGENNGTRITATGTTPSLTNNLGDASLGQHFIVGARCKPDNVDFAVLQLADLTGGCYITYNVATGAFGQELTWAGGPVINAHGIVPLLNGYYFIWMDVTTSDAYLNQLRINPARSADPNADTQSGDAIFCAGVSQQYAPATLRYIENPDSGTYTDKTFALPLDHDAGGNSLGVLNEPSATNLFLNSDAPVTQSITVANGTEYTVSVNGGWTATLSDAGTGAATEGNPVTFTAGSTNLTVTITGSAGGDLNNVQVEAGAVATSPIITADTTVERDEDRYSFDTTQAPWWTGAAKTAYANADAAFIADEPDYIASMGTGNHFLYATKFGAGPENWNARPGVTITIGAGVPGMLAKVALATEDAVDASTALNGALGGSATPTDALNGPTMYVGHDNSVNILRGHLKEIMILPRKMSNAELEALTT